MSNRKSGSKGSLHRQTASTQSSSLDDPAHPQMPTVDQGTFSQRLATEEQAAASISPAPSGQALSQGLDDGWGIATPQHSPAMTQVFGVTTLARLLDFMIELREKMLRISKVLHSLLFSTMETRRSEIKPAEARTFEWIFTSQSSPFIHWLRFLSGIFWIAGKAGSGKSTLMKYLSDDPHTYATLKEWGAGQNVVTASFFF